MALTVYIDGSFNGKKSVEAMREMLILLRGWILEEGLKERQLEEHWHYNYS